MLAELAPRSAWATIEADLRRALAQAGYDARAIADMIEALAPVVAAVERAGTLVDSELAWALLGVAADRRRRAARHERLRERIAS